MASPSHRGGVQLRAQEEEGLVRSAGPLWPPGLTAHSGSDAGLRLGFPESSDRELEWFGTWGSAISISDG